MSQGTVMKRPFGVTIVGILIIIAAVFNIVVGSMIIFAAFGDNPTFTDHLTGQQITVSTFYLWFNGGLMILLGIIYVWLTRLTFAGSATAQMLISVLAVLNIIFGFFNLGYGGWLSILVNLAILLIVNTQNAKAWFSQTA